VVGSDEGGVVGVVGGAVVGEPDEVDVGGDVGPVGEVGPVEVGLLDRGDVGVVGEVGDGPVELGGSVGDVAWVGWTGTVVPPPGVGAGRTTM
jgi:hypothetical protein